MELLNEVLSRDPEQIPALHLLIRIHTWQRDDDKLRAAFERLAEAAEAAGLVDEERRALVQLIHLSPDQDYLDRLHNLGDAPSQEGKPEQDSFSSTQEETPTFENFALVNESFTTADAMGLPATEESTEFEWNTVAAPPSAESSAEPAVTFKPDPSSSFADLNDEIGWAETETIETAPTVEDVQPATFTTGFQEIDFSAEALDSQTGGQAETTDGALDPQREALLKRELDSVDFYIAQGYTDIALDTLNMLERQFGQQDGITERRQQLTASTTAAAPASAPASAPADGASPAQEHVVEFTGFSNYDVAEEAAAVDESVELDNAFAELAAPASVDTTGEKPPGAQAEDKAVGIDPGLAAVFDEFRTAVEDDAPASNNGDYETHYNLGIAYKEMDLLDEAVEEFQAAAGLVAPRDNTPRYLQCCNMLGHCFMQKEMPRLAVMWFRKGLEAPGHSEDEYQALRYDLGLAYEQMGELERAIEVFTEVYGINVSYRGVADKLRELETQRAAK
jgi:tetratricopeptide (TPR) repeat protein